MTHGPEPPGSWGALTPETSGSGEATVLTGWPTWASRIVSGCPCEGLERSRMTGTSCCKQLAEKLVWERTLCRQLALTC